MGPDGLIRLLCVAGLVLSVYALYVEEQAQSNPGFEALCDFSATVSCSKVFTHRYGHLLFGLPNALYGTAYYVAMVVGTLPLFSQHAVFYQAVLAAAGGAAAFSVLLAVLLRELGDMCVLCMATWVINFLLLLLSYRRYAAFVAGKRKVANKTA